MAALVPGIVVGPAHRIVVIAGIFRIDGQQRDLPQIGAAQDRGPWRLAAATTSSENPSDTMRMNGYEADGLGLVHAAQPLDHTRGNPDERPDGGSASTSSFGAAPLLSRVSTINSKRVLRSIGAIRRPPEPL
jgi:hypothetical protein